MLTKISTDVGNLSPGDKQIAITSRPGDVAYVVPEGRVFTGYITQQSNGAAPTVNGVLFAQDATGGWRELTLVAGTVVSSTVGTGGINVIGVER